ncbi:hydrogenase expression protein HupH [Bradyrhizobium ottawaense]|uniref:aspartate/glutamate racemase family protein n=1 Tax=Bradyrhizobium ottawaense TaxID=931866 RepID=UPI000BE97309|nr:aspartate/glutamate racemase family protein [Bradyrhizobium ottawaense]PDT63970.1 hydrogenase expression protein HupH [Bradyrhizobium ottawaense]
MRIAYIVPTPMSNESVGYNEMQRRQGLLNSWAFPGTEVVVLDVADGPRSIESAYEEAISIPSTVDRIVKCERDGFDAAIIGCFADPGLEAARELVTMPVVGPCESSLLLAASLGHKFSVLTIFESMAAAKELLVRKVGVRDKLASVRATGIPVLELTNDPAATKARLVEVARACVLEDRADAFLFGCMRMSFLDMADEISAAVGAPAVNAARAALKHGEVLVSMGLAHSKTAFPTPAKMAVSQSARHRIA